MVDKPTDKFGEYLRSEGVEAEIKGRVAKRVAALDIVEQLRARQDDTCDEAATTIERYREALAPEIAGEPPHDGKEYQVTLSFPMRWKSYKPSSEQFRHGVKGRWQKMNEYGGWDNADGAGRHWPFVSYVDPQALSHAPEGQPGDGK